MIFDECFLGLAGKVMVGEVVPAEASELVFLAREAGADGMEPHLINHAMMSEIEAMRATRAVEQSELDEILGALKPLVEEGANA